MQLYDEMNQKIPGLLRAMRSESNPEDQPYLYAAALIEEQQGLLKEYREAAQRNVDSTMGLQQQIADLKRQLAEAVEYEKSFRAEFAKDYSTALAEKKSYSDAYSIVVEQISDLHEFMLKAFPETYTLTDKPVEAIPRIIGDLQTQLTSALAERDRALASCAESRDIIWQAIHGEPSLKFCRSVLEGYLKSDNPGSSLLARLDAAQKLAEELELLLGYLDFQGWGDVPSSIEKRAKAKAALADFEKAKG